MATMYRFDHPVTVVSCTAMLFFAHGCARPVAGDPVDARTGFDGETGIDVRVPVSDTDASRVDQIAPVPDATDGGVGCDLDRTRAYARGETVQCAGHRWRATQDVPRGIAPAGVGDGSPADRALLLAERVGFGRNAGTAGHDLSTAPVVHVTNASDSGAGSLRDALAVAGPKWIVFDGDYTLETPTTLTVPSDTVIDGRGHVVVINGPGASQRNTVILDVSSVQNVILEHLTVQKTGPLGTSSNPQGDDVHVGGSHDVWLDHLTLAESGDKELSTENGTHDLTGSWMHFVGGPGDDPAGEQMWGGGNQTNGGAEQVQTFTSHHNFFDGLVHATTAADGSRRSMGYRMPEFSYGILLHAFDDVSSGWVAYGVYCKRTGSCWIEDNVFDADPAPGGDTDGILFDVADHGSDTCAPLVEGVYTEINLPYSGSNVSGIVPVHASAGRNRRASSITSVVFSLHDAHGDPVPFVADGHTVTTRTLTTDPYEWSLDTTALPDGPGYTLQATVHGLLTDGTATSRDAVPDTIGVYNHGARPTDHYLVYNGCHIDGRPGRVHSVGNLLLHGATAPSNQPDLVPDPSQYYPYTAEPATPALEATVTSFAGAGSSPWSLDD